MKLALARFQVFLLLVALALPSLGPLIDHHFAERYHGHVHLTPLVLRHTHSYAQFHLHGYDRSESDGAVGKGISLLDYEGGPAAATIVLSDDSALRSILLLEPTSLFLLPLHPQARLKSSYVAPPDKPPQRRT
jgi:hypothetical protein